MKKLKMNKKAFTLVELLAVIVILAIILVIAVPKVINIINDSKKATLESTAKMVASAAEKKRVQNAVLGREENITCETVSKLNDIDYQTCYIEFINNEAYVTIIGDNTFDDMYICKGTKNESKVVDRCPNERVSLELRFNGGSGNDIGGVYKEGTILDAENPAKENATFIKWEVVKGNSIISDNKLTVGSEDTILHAVYENWLKFEIDLNGGSGKINYNEYYKNGTMIELEAPTKEGYTFTGWTAASGSVSGNTFTMGNSDVLVTANWRINSYAYNIEYKSSTGISLGTGAITYEYGTTNVVNPKEIPGYTSPSSQTVIWDSTNAKIIEFTYSPITYTISYTLNEGVLTSANKTSYTVETETFTLINPTKELYSFTGWTESNGGTANTNITITKGSTGNKVYTANWKSMVVNFAEDSWDIILKAVKKGTYPYKVGDTKTINLGSTYGTHTVRIANTTPCSAVSVSSKTACGFVIEFADIVTSGIMFESGGKGGWPSTVAYTLVNTNIYNALPTTLKNGIINTYVVSSHGTSVTGTLSNGNFSSTDKLYLLSPQEIFGSSLSSKSINDDSSYGTSRQLDYYSINNVTITNNTLATKGVIWWTRSANNRYDNDFHRIYNGSIGTYTGNNAYGLSPAFRIAE